MKDPAALIYFDKWISSTNGMKASFRAWYFDLLIYQYDKGVIPNDIDELAGICRVRPSEYDLFKQMVEQVLKQKFKQNEDGLWYNEVANETISKRKSFKEKRTKSGTIGWIIKKAKSIKGFNEEHLKILKKELFNKDIEELENYKDENLLKQVLKQINKLYINVDVNEDVDTNKDINADSKKKKVEKPELIYPFTTDEFLQQWDLWKNYKKKEHNFKYKTLQSEQASLKELSNLSKGVVGNAIKILHQSMANGWKGFFELKNNTNGNRNQNNHRTDAQIKKDISRTVDNFFSQQQPAGTNDV